MSITVEELTKDKLLIRKYYPKKENRNLTLIVSNWNGGTFWEFGMERIGDPKPFIDIWLFKDEEFFYRKNKEETDTEAFFSFLSDIKQDPKLRLKLVTKFMIPPRYRNLWESINEKS